MNHHDIIEKIIIPAMLGVTLALWALGVFQ
jgi:hypothetical protein